MRRVEILNKRSNDMFTRIFVGETDRYIIVEHGKGYVDMFVKENYCIVRFLDPPEEEIPSEILNALNKHKHIIQGLEGRVQKLENNLTNKNLRNDYNWLLSRLKQLEMIVSISGATSTLRGGPEKKYSEKEIMDALHTARVSANIRGDTGDLLCHSLIKGAMFYLKGGELDKSIKSEPTFTKEQINTAFTRWAIHLCDICDNSEIHVADFLSELDKVKEGK